MTISLIVAATENRVIGKDNDMPWHLPADLKYFKRTTLGHPIVMGRKTFESFGGRPLPKRRNLIITRNPSYAAEGAEVYNSVEDALAACVGEDEVFICGGSQIYELTFPMAKRLYLTVIHAELEGDTFLPELDLEGWKLESETFREKDEKNAYDMTWQVFTR